MLTDSSEPLAVIQALLALYPFKQLYIADINAIQKDGNHKKTLLDISAAFPALNIWLDAGFDEPNDVESWQSTNVQTVLGSESLKSVEQYQALLSASHNQAILSLDYRDDDFQGVTELLNSPSLWPKNVIVMTLNKVGSNAGPDIKKLKLTQNLSKQSSIYAAGGIRNSADLEGLKALGIEGVLVASALHNGTLSHNQIKSFHRWKWPT